MGIKCKLASPVSHPDIHADQEAMLCKTFEEHPASCGGLATLVNHENFKARLAATNAGLRSSTVFSKLPNDGYKPETRICES